VIKTVKPYLKLFTNIQYTINHKDNVIYFESINIDGINIYDYVDMFLENNSADVPRIIINVIQHLNKKYKDYDFWDYKDSEEFLHPNWKPIKFIYIFGLFSDVNLSHKIFLIDNNTGKNSCNTPNYIGRSNMLGKTYDFKFDISPRKFKKHFICLNRYEKIHREIIFDFISSELKDMVFLSYEPNNLNNPRRTVLDDLEITKGGTLHSAWTSTHQLYSFCNIVNEATHLDGIIHITEKTDKCFSAGQPFIIVAGPNYLKKLKELGFKTFDRWWDESYDDETDFEKRIELIKDTIRYISSWSIPKCESIYSEMYDILIHNQNLCGEYFKKGHGRNNSVNNEENILKKSTF